MKCESVADYLVDREIECLSEVARLEQVDFDEESLLKFIGSNGGDQQPF